VPHYETPKQESLLENIDIGPKVSNSSYNEKKPSDSYRSINQSEISVEGVIPTEEIV
jgi:hypothetical protein